MSFRAILGFGPRDVYALLFKGNINGTQSSGEVVHYDGVKATSLTTLSGSPAAIWGSSPSDIYVLHGAAYPSYYLGQPYITHFDGKTWSKVPNVPAISGYRGVWGSGPNNVYVVGGNRFAKNKGGTILRFDGASWSVVRKAAAPFAFDVVWGSGPNDVFVSGCCDANNNGGILHHDGTSWSSSLSHPWITFDSIWGSGPEDVFAAGKVGLYHYDGVAWSRQALPWHKGYVGQLSTVWGSRGSRVFSGGVLTMLRWDGQAWALVDRPPGSFSYETHYIFDMWGKRLDAVRRRSRVGRPGQALARDVYALRVPCPTRPIRTATRNTPGDV